jgi:hypothetical protein
VGRNHPGFDLHHPAVAHYNLEGVAVKEIIVKTQAEMDAIDVGFDGIIKVLGVKIIVKLKYKYRVVARGNSSVVARGNSSVEAWGNSSVVAWENSSVVARGNSSVEAWENVCVRIVTKIKSLSLFGLSVLFQPFDLNFKFKKEKTVLVQKVKPLPYLDREGIRKDNGSVILFKRVSADLKTQENTKNETLWTVGSTVTHPAWNPTNGECGEGKYHACSRPYFCDEFRDNNGDKYIAIKIKVADLHEWEKPNYPHKIAFRSGKVLYECDKHGNRLSS